LRGARDEFDRIQHDSERDIAIGNRERDSSRLVEVRATPRRIESRTFGVCIHCDENTRLAAVPWTSFSIACLVASDREKLPWNKLETSLILAA
jgi:DnaK suppressor protein